jgi:hypothetical protein
VEVEGEKGGGDREVPRRREEKRNGEVRRRRGARRGSRRTGAEGWLRWRFMAGDRR